LAYLPLSLLPVGAFFVPAAIVSAFVVVVARSVALPTAANSENASVLTGPSQTNYLSDRAL
jgi:hypothetical protein